MKTTNLLSLCILAACIAAGPAIAADQPLAQTAAQNPPARPDTPAPVAQLVSARPFQLSQPSHHLWRAERPAFSSGYLIVLKVDPALVFPRQTAEPVLYVGNQTAERVNLGQDSGHVVAIVPAVIDDPEHPDYLDLQKALIWFGTPELPERVDAATIRRERALALRSGLKPLPPAQVAEALRNGGPALSAHNKQSLYGPAADLIRKFSPQETELADVLKAQSGT